MKIPRKDKEFRQWLYSKKETKFLFFCCIHVNLMRREQDFDAPLFPADVCKVKCDYPKCKEFADREFFPNMITIFTEANNR